MKTTLRHLLVLIALMSLIAQTGAQSVNISVTDIRRDEYIKGNVAGLRDPSRFKVVVYVRTDRWYIHPYADLGEGRSWARIGEDGIWSLPTVWRGSPASELCALVVRVDVNMPAIVENIEAIPHLGIKRQSLLGTADNNKL